MTNTWDDFVNDLAQAPIVAAYPKAAARPTFPCGQCAGSGKWVGGSNRYGNSNCIACKGKGYFLSSREDRAKAAFDRRANKNKALEAGVAAFKVAHPAMYEELKSAHSIGEGNAFVLSLADQLFTRGGLTDNQTAAWYRGKAKLDVLKAEKAAAVAAAPLIDLGPIRAMFETAVGSGYKRPTYRAEGLVINRAPDSGSNPGALYVKTEDGDYKGKVVDVKFHGVRGSEGVVDLLAKIAVDPLAAALRYGQRTGTCACCGRKLTAHGSIDLGIGPICKEKFGL